MPQEVVMDALLLRWLLADVPPLPTPSPFLENKLLLLWGGGAVTLFLIVVVVWLTGSRKKVNPEAGLDEKLAEYPPAPAGQSTRLAVQGLPGRLRLVVIAPLGKRPLDSSNVEGLLNGLLPGLGEVVKQDQPRVRLWPPQLSQQGFAPTFGRLTHRPEPADQPSRWVLAAGPAKTQGQQVLIGLAIQTEKANNLNLITLGPLEWGNVLRVS
jgi:hypothetical protein